MYAFALSTEGYGLADDAEEKMFTPFYTTKSDGMGIGLSVCHSIIQSHGGTLNFERNPEGGAILWFTFPSPDLPETLVAYRYFTSCVIATKCQQSLYERTGNRYNGESRPAKTFRSEALTIADFESIRAYMHSLGQHKKKQHLFMARVEYRQKNLALLATADSLDASRAALDIANRKGSGQCPRQRPDRRHDRPVDPDAGAYRSDDRGAAAGRALPDPVGTITDMKYVPSGLQIGQMRVPLGVIGIIYESRPNVTVEAASLCLKSGNAVILRGGSEAIHSTVRIASCACRMVCSKPSYCRLLPCRLWKPLIVQPLVS